MPFQTHTIKTRGYTTKAGYADLERVLGLLRGLYNGGLEDRRADYQRKLREDGEWVTAESGFHYRRLQQLAPGEKRDWVGLAQQNPQLKYIRADNPEYAAIDNQLLNAVLTRLDTAYAAVFGRIQRGEKPGFPRFKNVARFRTIEARTVSPAWLRYKDQHTAYLQIKGLPRIELRHNGRIPLPVWGEDGVTKGRVDKATGEIIGGGNPKRVRVRGTWPLSVKITLRGRRLWVSLAYEIDKPELPPADAEIGIDRGVHRRAAFSGGYQPPDSAKTRRRAERKRAASKARVKKHRQRQAKLRRAAVKDGQAHYHPIGNGRARVVWHHGVSRAYRQSGAIARNIEERQGIAVQQATHRLTTDIIRRFDVVALEKLNIRGMTASAAGTTDEPGRRVAQKRGLNREILAQNWGELARQLAYKAAWAGRDYGEVNPAFTSQICHHCGRIGKRTGVRFECLYSDDCGWRGDADDNAAINILARYLAKQTGTAWPCPARDAGYRGETAPLAASPCAAGIVSTPEPPLAGGPRHAPESVRVSGQLRLF